MPEANQDQLKLDVLYSPVESGSPAPNMFIVGAMKSGTTALHTYLAQHPQVFMSEVKEPAYFVPEHPWHPKDRAWYLGLFAEAHDAKVIGESSTHYSKRPTFEGVPERIAQFCPSARIIYIMRHPIGRAISHYWHNIHHGREHRKITRALSEGSEYRAFSDYAYQLEPYLRAFGPSNVLLLTFERLARDPEQLTNSVLAWLGLDPLHGDTIFSRENVRPTKMTLETKVVNRLRRSRAWDRVSPLVPRWVKARMRAATERWVSPAEVSTDEVVRLLKPWAEGRIAALEDLTARSFPEWRQDPEGDV